MKPSTPASRLGSLIRQRRLELGWTQEQLAERISADHEYVRQSEISRIENGWVGLPRRGRLERIARALDLSIGEILATSSWNGTQCTGCGRLVAQSWESPDASSCARCRYEDELILQEEQEALWVDQMARSQSSRLRSRVLRSPEVYTRTG